MGLAKGGRWGGDGHQRHTQIHMQQSAVCRGNSGRRESRKRESRKSATHLQQKIDIVNDLPLMLDNLVGGEHLVLVVIGVQLSLGGTGHVHLHAEVIVAVVARGDVARIDIVAEIIVIIRVHRCCCCCLARSLSLCVALRFLLFDCLLSAPSVCCFLFFPFSWLTN